MLYIVSFSYKSYGMNKSIHKSYLKYIDKYNKIMINKDRKERIS